MKALVLAGGFAQIALIKELKKRGIKVLLADYYDEPVAKKHADVFYQVSTLDIGAITEVAKKEKVDFIITACTDQALHTVAYVSEKLGLPCYIDYEAARNVTNKEYMKKVFVENDIPTAKHITAGVLKRDEIAHLHYPLIVKPVDCNSSKGVKKVNNYEELETAFNKAVEYSRTNTAVIEEFIQGVEISVDIYVEDGKAKVLAVSKSEKIASDEKFVIFRGGYPVEEAKSVMPQIESTVQKIADAFGLKNTPMLVQLLTDGEKIAVLEFSARTGGGVKYLLIKNSSGFDVIKAVVDLTLGEKPHFEKREPLSEFYVNEFIYCKPGIFERLDGFEELKQEGIMKDYYIFKWRGAEFDTVESSGDRVGGFSICADNFEELSEKHNEIAKRIKVIGKDGTDIMRHDLLTEL